MPPCCSALRVPPQVWSPPSPKPRSLPLTPPQAEDLQRLGLEPTKAYMLETAEVAAAKHKKSVSGWCIQRALV